MASYPRLVELKGHGALAYARSLAEKLLYAGAAAGLAAVANGCAPPTCQPTRLDEVKVHGDTALSDVGSFQLKDAAHELGVGLGVVPHPVAMPMAGMMIAVTPTPIDDAGAPTPEDGGVAGDVAPTEAPGGS